MNKRNYHKELEKIIEENSKSGNVPSLLLHACCAPCSSYCLEYLSRYFEITLFYFNPNIYPEEEYAVRAKEAKRLVSLLPSENKISVVICDFDSSEFYTAVKGLEGCPEGGERCRVCFDVRLNRTAAYAKENGFDYFTTTLSISPLKNADTLNLAGERAAERYGVSYLPSDFKKKGGYLRSITLSKEYGLYRQNYCGCVFSLREENDGENITR